MMAENLVKFLTGTHLNISLFETGPRHVVQTGDPALASSLPGL